MIFKGEAKGTAEIISHINETKSDRIIFPTLA